MLANIAELIDQGNRLFITAHSKKGATKPKPIKIKRPLRTNEKEPEKRKATPADMVRLFGAPGPPPAPSPKSGAE